MNAAGWQADRLSPDAIPVADRLPAERDHVIAWVSDESVAIYFLPVIAWRIGDGWWGGLPTSYIDMRRHRWAVTHWRPIPMGEET